MFIITDSGSTKTQWALCNSHGEFKILNGSGINPRFMDFDNIVSLLNKELDISTNNVDKVFFYGSGCGSAQAVKLLQNALEVFFNTKNVFIETDLLGAARGLWANEKGLVAILGTGSNCCFYDGKRCSVLKPSLGYLFGDEGSGSYLGKEFLKLFLKNKLPEYLSNKFKDEYALNNDIILSEVYYNKFPNRYLGNFVPFLSKNIDNPFVSSFVENAFGLFFDEYFDDFKNNTNYKLKITGSVAFYFKDILLKISEKNGIIITDIVKNPLENLIKYHLTEFPNIT